MGAYAGPTQTWGESNISDSARIFASTKLVVQSGLVLNLDAGVSSSYPGSGTTWTDLSGNNVIGDLTNGPTYSSSNGGFLSFDGTNDFVSVSSGIPERTNQFTNEIWVYPTSISGGQNGWSTLIRMYGSRVGGGSGDFYFLLNSNGGVTHSEINQAGTGYNQWSTSNGIISTNNWYHIVQVIDRTLPNVKFYVNNVLRLNLTVNNYGVTTNSSIQIAQQGTDPSNTFARRLKGRVSNVKLYNRVLTADEIQQNFNATRSRFSI